MFKHILKLISGVREAISYSAKMVYEWLEWGELSPYRAGVFLYLMLEAHALVPTESVAEGWTQVELYCLGLGVYLQVFVTPGATSLLTFSPLLYFVTLYLKGLSGTLPIKSALITSSGMLLFFILALLELAQRARAKLGEERRLYEVQRVRSLRSDLSQLRALSPEGLTLSLWFALSPFVLLVLTRSELSFSSVRRFELSLPCLVFLMTTIGAALKLPVTSQGDDGREAMRRSLTISLSSSLILNALIFARYFL